MAKGQMRSNKEKKKPKQDKNKKKGSAAPSPFASSQEIRRNRDRTASARSSGSAGLPAAQHHRGLPSSKARRVRSNWHECIGLTDTHSG